jgi:hypothetical protein
VLLQKLLLVGLVMPPNLAPDINRDFAGRVRSDFNLAKIDVHNQLPPWLDAKAFVDLLLGFGSYCQTTR